MYVDTDWDTAVFVLLALLVLLVAATLECVWALDTFNGIHVKVDSGTTSSEEGSSTQTKHAAEWFAHITRVAHNPSGRVVLNVQAASKLPWKTTIANQPERMMGHFKQRRPRKIP
mmetsp:Transcript_16553/g.32348  ORF Transcript_16553/g.32348 Transcript_16553/m.32348 type:complete len:115 (-) Transcript_16553:13-357(-)